MLFQSLLQRALLLSAPLYGQVLILGLREIYSLAKDRSHALTLATVGVGVWTKRVGKNIHVAFEMLSMGNRLCFPPGLNQWRIPPI